MKSNSQGFSLIEIIMAISLLSIFFVIVGNFSSTKPIGDNSMKEIAYSQIDSLVKGALFEGSNGYSIIAGVKGERDSKNLLPSDYLIFFQPSNKFDVKSTTYYKIGTQRRSFGGNYYTRVINHEEIEGDSTRHYIRKIVGKINESDLGTELQNFTLSYTNPTGKENFYVNNNSFIQKGNIVLSDDSTNTVNEFLTPAPDATYTIIDIYVYDTEGNKSFIYRIYKDKQSYAY